MLANLRKESYLHLTPLSIVMLGAFWFVIALYFLAAYQEYQTLAPQLARLESPRGATQMLLVAVNQLVIGLMVLWSSVFGARSIAQEYEWHTAQLLWVQNQGMSWYRAKIFWQLLALCWISVPFWFAVCWLGHATGWDKGLLLGIFSAQLLIAVYACLLASALSAAFKQGLSAALTAVIIWLGLWLAPILVTEPAGLNAMLQWFSPFAHTTLMMQGQFTLQTLLFFVMHSLFFITWLRLNVGEND